jgi:hypothetical protein
MNLKNQRRRKQVDGESGQAAFELLMIFPVFVIIVLLAIDFGMWMYQSVSVANAVREGARYAALKCPGAGTCDEAAIKIYTASKSAGSLDTTNIHVSFAAEGSIAAGGKGSSVIVEACQDYTLLFAPITIGSGLTSSANMRLEQNVTSFLGSTC